jgi:hypothetical protein
MTMKDYLKNSNFYYVLVPVVACAWVIFVTTVSLGKANKEWDKQKAEWNTSQRMIAQILNLDPERLNIKVDAGFGGEFDYSIAVEETAKLCKISSYSMTSGLALKSAGKGRKTATVTIKTVDIEQLAQFLSQMLQRSPNLECDLLTLTKLKTGKDSWKTSVKFSYTYEK